MFKKNNSNSFFILIDLWLIIPLRYREWGLFQNTLQTFPKQLPPKTEFRESQDRVMIDEFNRGFGLCPLV
jgi:hypothetical protein